MTPEDCPHCGEPVPAGARACPHCGSDESTGWSDASDFDRLGVSDPDEPFDHDAFVQNEFGRADAGSARPNWIWLLITIVLLLALLGLLY